MNDDNYKRSIKHLEEHLPEVVEPYHALTGTCFQAGEIEKKQKHLIALGISMSHRDDNCVRYHVQEAIHEGASEREIWETVGVTIALSGGLAVSQCLYWVTEALQQGPDRG
ncbi:carboxymuconolactone decarboxylase family protein [Brevibacillus brevis]|uniref:Carboxymuconolactone decarboxylase family protein n=1 Tax=Brevibacillus brevis TaxID=1393 RepID=A0ABY9T5S6_BREBE|nr:carboxymuconolactone decarboxylase family protein [Brevibacillus brevis]WNC15458.1 carboxymuconolactone decarboxylase family protein [Brevibacillus brevis]